MNAFLKLLRVHQWTKNLFVFVGVFFAELFLTSILIDAIFVFVSFCLASSIVYIMNDIKDVESDRQHPKKKHRPIASGAITEKQAIGVLALLIVGITLSFLIIPLHAIFIIVSYIAFNMAYTQLLKHIVLLDVFSIAFSFMLRVFAGTYGIGVPASSWLLITIIALALFLSLAKRYNEISLVGKKHRKVLGMYSPEYLNNLVMISATLSIAFYSLYTISINKNIFHIATIPLVMYGFFRYLHITHIQKGGGDPSEELYKDKHILVVVLLWIVLLLFGMIL